MPSPDLRCPVCAGPLELKLAHGKRTGKVFVMLICPVNGKHLRAFISDKDFVGSVLAKLEEKTEK
jgi:uncharacterized protein YbaR (Trm112 family)